MKAYAQKQNNFSTRASLSLPRSTPVRLQTKLRVNTPGDIYEREADRVAEEVMNMQDPQVESAACSGHPNLQNGDQPSQTKSVEANEARTIESAPVVNENSPSRDHTRDTSTRRFSESRFGHDFSQVRVCSGMSTANRASALKAGPYMVNRPIAFVARLLGPQTPVKQGLSAPRPSPVAQQIAENHAILQRQPSKTNKDAKHGELKVTSLSFGYERLSPDEGIESVTIELAFVRTAESKYADPSTINWLQTVRTNFQTSSNEGPPADADMHDFVDGGPSGKGEQTASFFNLVNGSVLFDTLHRASLKDRNVYWKAETSAVGISTDGLEILGTKEWGFELDKKGKAKSFPARSKTTLSPYHVNKFEELKLNPQ